MSHIILEINIYKQSFPYHIGLTPSFNTDTKILVIVGLLQVFKMFHYF